MSRMAGFLGKGCAVGPDALSRTGESRLSYRVEVRVVAVTTGVGVSTCACENRLI